MRPFEEPTIGGDRLLVSHADFERSCKVLLWEEQQKLDCNNAVVSVLCNAVRLSREYCHAMRVTDRTDLLDRIKSLELELERAKSDRNAEGVRQRAEYLPKLEQAHAALKLAGEALESLSYWTHHSGNKRGQAALAAIKACGAE